jgi:hypothetical protein
MAPLARPVPKLKATPTSALRTVGSRLHELIGDEGRCDTCASFHHDESATSQARASIALEFNGSRKRSQPPRLWSKIANRVDLASSRGVAAFIQLRSATDRAPLMHCMADRALLSARSRGWRRSRIEFGWADVKFLVTSRQPASMNTRRACQGAPQSKQISPSDRLEKAAQVIINGLSFGGIPSPTMALPGTCDRQLLRLGSETGAVTRSPNGCVIGVSAA